MFWIPHIDGIPFRKLGDEHGLSGKQAYERVFAELALLPNNTEVTKRYCEYSSGILIMDGKYIKVKGYKQKIPFIYGIDYRTHDIVFGMLAPSEDIPSFLTFFHTLKALQYPLTIVVADDRSSLPLALKQVFPGIPLQLCLNHFLENIRIQLHIRTDATHRHFFNSVKKHLFTEYTDETNFKQQIIYIFKKHARGNTLRTMIVKNIYNRRRELFAYKEVVDCPNNTNLIELFNSHFNARIRALKGFKNKPHAKLWLNGLMLRRRTKPFTDCGPKFSHLNGKCSLELCIKKQASWPEILGWHAPKR